MMRQPKDFSGRDEQGHADVNHGMADTLNKDGKNEST
jgi:hypothetical protein